ncbi:MAG: hypothetical protein LBJ69_01475 [Holosporales bacterium]|jgi:hypothetical protein|nr:hypothetical protein [Holosporales bacterium]
MAVYKELLGHPAVEASGTGPGAVKAQAPTGLFLFTHQQWLYHGAMQFVAELYNTIPQPEYMRIVIERIIHRQLDESDWNTSVQKIRSRWRWRAKTNPSTTGNMYIHTYATAVNIPPNPRPLCVVTIEGDRNETIPYANDNGGGYTTLSAPMTIPSIMAASEVARITDDAIADEITQYPIHELAMVASSNTISQALPSHYTDINTHLGTNLQYGPNGPTGAQRSKAATVFTVINCVYQATMGTMWAGAYITYQREPTPQTDTDGAAEDPA